jgi:TolB-like protein/Flp pilus assembly protein TadD
MDALASPDILVFEGFRLDRRLGRLLKQDEDGAWRPVAIGSRALHVLAALTDRPGILLSRDAIIAAAWPGTVVEDANLAVQISALRRVLDRDRAEGSCIQTIPGRGYRFVAPVTRIGAETRSDVRTARTPSDGDERSRPRLSIVVLPFANLSDDREQQYFADGITEDLTTDLSRLAHSFVISCNTAFTYRNKPIDTAQIGRDFGVRCVLEGSVRRSGSYVRVNAQLIDAATDAHLWAERFDGDTVDLFALQNEITSRLAKAIGVELIAAEAARPTEHPDALDYILRGRAVRLKPLAADVLAEAISLFERALALDPQSVEAQIQLARSLMTRVMNGMTESAGADVVRAEGLVDPALVSSPRYVLAHFIKGNVLRTQNRWEEATLKYETVLALDRNSVQAYQNLGWCKLYTGSIEEVVPLVEQAIRLSPGDPDIWGCYYLIGIVHLLQSRSDEAILWLEKARHHSPRFPLPHGYLASAYALRGETERATAELVEARKPIKDGRYSSIAHVRAIGRYGVPKTLALYEATYFAGLRKAGVPEQ